jgi:hypothetical protein
MHRPSDSSRDHTAVLSGGVNQKSKENLLRDATAVRTSLLFSPCRLRGASAPLATRAGVGLRYRSCIPCAAKSG